jgi:hypothetical protein
MMLTDLDKALRAWGIPYWEGPGWQSFGHGEMDSLRGILIHHTAGGGKNDWLTVRNGRPGLVGPLAHMTLERNGSVRLLAAGLCYHAGSGSHPVIGTNNGNLRMIGIEGVSPGIGSNAWTREQLETYPRLVASLLTWYRLPVERALFHLEWATPRGRKIDAGQWPGGPRAFRDTVSGLLHGLPLGEGGIEDMALNTKFVDWNRKQQTVQSWMDNEDKRLAVLYGDVPPEDHHASRRVDTGYIRERIPVEVWDQTITNLSGQEIAAKQILTAIEKRVDELQAAVQQLIDRHSE